jgi:phospholipid/cholesterol/gamma-HCH transport system ATP-binding protein
MARDPILTLKNIHKSFVKNQIHKGVDLELQKGETLGLLGGSGTGKSVLLRSIIGLEFIDKGEIHYNGRRIDDLTEVELQKIRIKVSYSFQSGALFDSSSVFDNIAYPLFEHTCYSLSEIQSKVSDVLKLVRLEGKEELMPSDLSGGMQKRVGMARAIIMEPEIILYDEPTAGLDPSNIENVVEVMQKLKGMGHAGIFVTHDIPSALKLCDRIAILHEGKIIFNDTPKELKSSTDSRISSFITNEEVNHGNQTYG